MIPTASSLGHEVLEVYDALFRKLGAAEVVPVRPETREEAHDPDLVDGARQGHRHLHDRRQPAQAVRRSICGTPSATRSSRRTERGAVVAGTSAGASIQSSHMVAFGGPAAPPPSSG